MSREHRRGCRAEQNADARGAGVLTRVVASYVAERNYLRSLASVQVVGAALGFLAVVPLAVSDGGYWPTAWSWTTLVFSWVAALALLVRSTIQTSFVERLFVAFIASLSLWTVASLFWSISFTRTVFEVERTLAYLAVVLAAVILLRAGSYQGLLGGIWAGVVFVCTYSLATRLFPERLGVFDPVAGYRLSEPLGYWNALGIFAGLGALLAIGLASRANSRLIRSLSAASLLVLLPTVFFTFSRGAWIAVGLGLAGAIVLDPRRLQLVTAVFAFTPAPVIALALAYRSDALTRLDATLQEASSDGHRLALVLLGLAVLNVLVALAFATAERRLTISAPTRRTYAVLLAVALLVAVGAAFVRFGGPVTMVDRARDAFTRPAPQTTESLNERLFTLSSRARVTAWRTARDDAADHLVLGAGGGTFELYWFRHRPSPTKIRDAHSLYLETLAELGPAGLVILLGALAMPVIGAVKARRNALVPAAFSAYLAYLARAGIDWDWEMTAVTVTAFLCGLGTLIAARADDAEPLSRGLRFGLIAVSLVLAAVAFVGVNGNGALADAREDANAGRWLASETDARQARRWMPWSSDPWQLTGEAQLARGDLSAARDSFRAAIDKDPDDWELWSGLAAASTGKTRREAVAQALRLNPRDPGLLRFAESLGVR